MGPGFIFYDGFGIMTPAVKMKAKTRIIAGIGPASFYQIAVNNLTTGENENFSESVPVS